VFKEKKFEKYSNYHLGEWALKKYFSIGSRCFLIFRREHNIVNFRNDKCNFEILSLRAEGVCKRTAQGAGLRGKGRRA
jgi:hypothetical protein